MSRKTRKQKKMADTHRQTNSMAFSYVAPTTSIKNTVVSEDLVYFKKDLLKTLFLAIIFLTAEITIAIFSNRIGW